MSYQQMKRFRSLEGYQVSLALADGSRIDACQLVSLGRDGVENIWLYANGADRFVPHAAVIDLWEAQPGRHAA
jgi:hypothetical protein